MNKNDPEPRIRWFYHGMSPKSGKWGKAKQIVAGSHADAVQVAKDFVTKYKHAGFKMIEYHKQSTTLG